jgi:aspartyl/asparaginyl beta-hydroxylase (cupin superfamily)
MSTISPTEAEYLLEYVRKLARRAGISQSFLARVENGIQTAGGLDSTLPVDPLQRPLYFYLPGLTAKPFWDSNQFDWVPRLEAEYKTIRSELLALRDNHAFGLHPQADLIGAGVWAEYHFFAGEKKFEQNCARCPRTTEIIESIVEAKSCGLKYFSAHAPDTAIKPHCGPYNLRLRCHLGLIVPDDCGFRVGAETRSWEEGKCLVFDDSFFHEAWNKSNQTRIVLLIDSIHPDLSSLEVAFLEKLGNVVEKMRDDYSHTWRVNELKKSEKLNLPEGWWV